ncbi:MULTISPECIES: MarR family transcriptional regulator [Faecalibacterium]|uniref:MarR family transcriptional regulator n=1 Tax=Faecalibacterium TaxID=216851 RepID=UPI000E492BEB|nr:MULTISPECIES: MarR family transcriptional regulator [Faecalibacterium]RHQ28900.1 MarR family transcriptional regulator [Faecalibacterium sp. AF28-13AC]
MEYLKRVLGIEVLYENKALEHLPNFINTRYVSQRVFLNGQKVAFLYPKNELEQVETLKKHLERVKKSADCPVVLVLEQITARQREYLLREKVAFIVDGKQIYLPFMAVYLQERCDAEKSDREEILPSAQMLLLYFIYEGAKELSTSQAAKDLELTPTSISRASKQLEEMELLQAKKIGVQKILSSENSPKELFYKAEKALLSPVKRTVYIPDEKVKIELLESGYSALAEYSMLNAPSVRCYASEKISQWNDFMTKDLQDSNSQVAIEMWRYDPRKLSREKMVDELSLALSLREDADERVEEAVEEMLNNLWRKIDGNRN